MTEKHETKPNDFLSNIWVSTKWRLGKRVPAKQYIFLFMRFSFQQYVYSYTQLCSASSSRLENTKTRMEACVAVEKEIDKILSKFASIRENGSKNIEETIEFLSSIKPELEQGSVNS